jgi:anti-sigma factor RsiW
VSKNCIDPAAIREGDLMAYVDGIAEKAVAQHIRRCPACARAAQELAVLQSALTINLYRHSCPDPDLLLAHRQGELEGGEELALAQHLRQCPHCARELSAVDNTR